MVAFFKVFDLCNNGLCRNLDCQIDEFPEGCGIITCTPIQSGDLNFFSQCYFFLALYTEKKNFMFSPEYYKITYCLLF